MDLPSWNKSSRFSRRVLFPWSDGTARLQDASGGTVDRDIQWYVNDVLQPEGIIDRAKLEQSLQEQRDRGELP